MNNILTYKIKTNEEVMVSFDTVSFFTNIPVNETIDLCTKLSDKLVENKVSSMSSKAIKALRIQYKKCSIYI